MVEPRGEKSSKLEPAQRNRKTHPKRKPTALDASRIWTTCAIVRIDPPGARQHGPQIHPSAPRWIPCPSKVSEDRVWPGGRGLDSPSAVLKQQPRGWVGDQGLHDRGRPRLLAVHAGGVTKPRRDSRPSSNRDAGGVEATGGSVSALRGDEALAVFGSPCQALGAAVDLQGRFMKENVSRAPRFR